MFEKVAAIIAEIMNVDVCDITQRTPLRGPDGMNEMDFARLVIALEKRFGVTVYDVDAVTFFFVEDVCNYLTPLTGGKKAERNDDESPIDLDEYFYSE